MEKLWRRVAAQIVTDEANKPVKFVERAGGIQRHYVNYVAIDIDNFCDLRLFGGQYIGTMEGPPQHVVEGRVEVTLTWIALKSLVLMAQQKIAEYEERNGEIKLPLLTDSPATETSEPAEPENPEAVEKVTPEVIH